jgi:hypothetical protein
MEKGVEVFKEDFLLKFIYKCLPIIAQRRHLIQLVEKQLAIDPKFKKLTEQIYKLKKIPLNYQFIRIAFLSWITDIVKDKIDFTKFLDVNWEEIVHYNNQCLSIIYKHKEEEAKKLLERFAKVPNKRKVYRQFNPELFELIYNAVLEEINLFLI